MAKYEITMSCGHIEVKELFGKNSDREDKIRYFERQGLCRDCYKKVKQEEAKAEGLVFNVSVLPDVDNEDGSILLQIYFSGDTMSHKDEIKSLGGYRWDEKQESGFNLLFAKNHVLCWNKIIKLDDLQAEAAKADSIGAVNNAICFDLFSSVDYQFALEKQAAWKEKHEKIAMIKRPAAPAVLAGHKWNQKIYGKSGNYSVYTDGEKVEITDEQAEEIKIYLVKKEKYAKKLRNDI